MEAIALVCGPVEGKVAARSEAALAERHAPSEIDESALARELEALLA